MLRNFFTLAFRNLLKQKQTTLISIIGLIISFSVILQIAGWVNFETSFDKYNRKAERIYRFTVEENMSENNFYWHFARSRQPWRTKLSDFYTEIESLTELRSMGPTTVKTDNNLFDTRNSFAVDSTFFNVFDFNFTEGNSSAIIARNTVVISESFAKKLFPNQDAIYKTVELSGGYSDSFEKYTIAGIFKDMPDNSHFHADILIHYIKKQVYGNDFAYTYILLKEGSTIEQIKSRVEQFKKVHVPQDQQKSSILHFTPLTDIHLKSHIEREIEPNGDMRQVKLFIFIALGILLISLINYINLSIASFEKRSKYFYLNRTIGAKLKHHVILLLIESSVIAVIVTLISAILFQPLSMLLISTGIIKTISFSNVLTFLISVSFLASVMASGVLPIFMAKLNPSSFLHNSSILLDKKSSFINNSLLVLQFTLSIVIIICSLMLNKQNNFLFSKELGYGNENIIMIPRDFWAEETQVMLLKENLLKIPSVKEVSMCMDPPGYLVKDSRRVVLADIPDENKKQIITMLPVDGNFFSFFNISLIAGSEREYIPGQQYENYILNESAIKKLGFTSAQNAIGTKFKLEDFNKEGIIRGGTIIGVVKDFNFSSLYNPIDPTIFFQKPIWQWRYLVKLTPGNMNKNLAGVKQVWEKIFPDHPFNYQFLDDSYKEYYNKDVITNKLVGCFSVICVILSCIGLWCISSISVIRKTKWIGICKVNGAKISEVMIMLNKDFVKWIAIAFVTACPVAWYAMHHWLENFAYKTELSWWIFAAAGLLAILIALLTVSWQSWKAATRNPVEALRYE